MVQRFNKKNLPTKKSLKINGLVLGFFFCNCCSVRVMLAPYFINSMAPV